MRLGREASQKYSVTSYRENAKQLGASIMNSRSYDLESWCYVQHKDFQLQVLQRIEDPSKTRPIIPTVEAERLAFFRGYTTAPFKIQKIFMQQMNYATFFWLYLTNALFRSLPMNYIHLFLASYCPSEHLYGSKMIPICSGVSWQVVFGALLQLVASVDILSMFFNYASIGFLYRDPWYKCDQASNNTLEPNPLPYECIDIMRFTMFSKVYQNGSSVINKTTNIKFTKNFYKLDGVQFTAAPIDRFMKTWVKTSVLQYNAYEWMLMYLVLWGAAAACNKQLYKKWIWQVLKRVQYFFTAFLAFCLLFMLYAKVEDPLKPVQIHYSKRALAYAKINPGRDATVITLSNSVMYFFMSLVCYHLKIHVDAIAQLPVSMSQLNYYPVFYLWPFFFSTMSLGNTYIRIFYVTCFLHELLVFIITYQILVEVMVSEWVWAKRWIATALISGIGLLMNCFVMYESKSYMYLLYTAVASMTEVVFVCWLYPLDRLFNDVHFINGTVMPAWRKWSLRFVPFYCFYKIYTCLETMSAASQDAKKSHSKLIFEDMSCAEWAWALPLIPLPIGALFAIYKYIYVQKQSWTVLFKPRPDWAPVGHMSLELRRQFVSNDFIKSQAPRCLSRLMVAKEQAQTYRLDVCYDDVVSTKHRRSTVVSLGGLKANASFKNIFTSENE